MSNRLANASSPYLLQHRNNPVDWYPWGEEAFERARRDDMPILLSVGYSACHWCHVMARESFEDPSTAAIMNEHFVNVKVDREEHPDVDAFYMQAVQRMTGHGGWPMTVFLTPDGRPFYGGTYFPPEPRHGLPAFSQLLEAIASAYEQRREEVDSSAEDLTDELRQGISVNPEPQAVDEAVLTRAQTQLRQRYDSAHGGFGGAPKFPQPMLLDFLLRFAVRNEDEDSRTMVLDTLDAMANGGIRDHIGGGFHRYAVDARWLVPHFEKMLYDNAQLARLYTRAWQATGETRHREVAASTLGYLTREMRHPDGGFYSSQDAESEGEEGRFYVWSTREFDEALADITSDEELRFLRQFFDVSNNGNWEGTNILNTPAAIEAFAVGKELDASALRALVERARSRLYETRGLRVRPGLDDKILTSWNAMAVQAFAEAARAFDEPDYQRVAEEATEFLLSRLRAADGEGLLRSWRAGEARIPGYLEDYALLTDALIDLYQASFDLRWVREARRIADSMIARFWSPEEKLFYDAEQTAEGALVVRPRDIYDNATPSGTSAAAVALGRLAALVGEPRYEQIASRVVRSFADVASRIPQAFGHLLTAVLAHASPPSEVAIVGNPEDPDTRELLDVLRLRLLPSTVVALKSEGPGGTEAEEVIPLLAERQQHDGRATAFVCQNYVCRLPVTTAADLSDELDRTIRRS